MLLWCPERRQKYIVFPEETSYPHPLKGNGEMAVDTRLFPPGFSSRVL